MKVIPKIEDGRIVLVFPDTPTCRGCIELWAGAHHEASKEYIDSIPNATDNEEIHRTLQKYNNSLPYWEKVTHWEIVASTATSVDVRLAD